MGTDMSNNRGCGKSRFGSKHLRQQQKATLAASKRQQQQPTAASTSTTNSIDSSSRRSSGGRNGSKVFFSKCVSNWFSAEILCLHALFGYW